MKYIIDIPEDVFKRTVFYREFRDLNDCVTTIKALEKAVPLPKGYGRLIDENYLLSILQCEEYEICDWKDCSDCNREKSIKKREVLGAPTIIEADKENKE